MMQQAAQQNGRRFSAFCAKMRLKIILIAILL
jgi:hypothetical protein